MLGLGPMFPTSTKANPGGRTDGSVAGPTRARSAHETPRHPHLAIGGIGRSTSALREAGVRHRGERRGAAEDPGVVERPRWGDEGVGEAHGHTTSPASLSNQHHRTRRREVLHDLDLAVLAIGGVGQRIEQALGFGEFVSVNAPSRARASKGRRCDAWRYALPTAVMSAR